MTTTYELSKLMFKSFMETVDTVAGEQPDYASFFCPNTINTTQLWEEIVQVEGLGPMQRMNESGGMSMDKPFAPYSKKFYWNIFGIGWERSFDAEDTDQSGHLRKFSEWVGQSRWWAMQADLADMLDKAATNTTEYQGIDGKPLASASHPTINGGTWSNIMDAAPLIGPAMLESMIDKADATVTWRNMIWTYRGNYRVVIHDKQRPIMERIFDTPERQGTANNDRVYAKKRISDWQCNPFLTQKGYTHLIAEGKHNPFFVLKKGSMQVLQDVDTKAPKRITTAFDRWGKGWKRAQGVIVSAGVLEA